MPRNVVIPSDIERRLKELTKLEQETNGVLLFKPSRDQCPVDGVYITAVGSPGHVRAMKERLQIINEFFKRHPEFRYVKFHTHSEGTIRQYGKKFAQQLSEGDRDSYKDQLREDKEFMGMLVTPEKIIIVGIDNPTLEISESNNETQERERIISESINSVAREMGLSHERLNGTMKR